MGWLKRLFGMEQKPGEAAPTGGGGGGAATAGAIPAERVGLGGEYDQSGLAKRVAAAFDQDAELTKIETVWVAQTGGTVVLKGQVPEKRTLERLEAIARGVSGATSVDSHQVKIG